ncbi:hypothetical protein VTJ83DRAFT_3110 [Remersonia thermophila]|uniref:Uncharacterized protein n=1 Tax=Remersonia thermophila TaxID=72144 RepID=A0ABR4DE04_9PEZI
MRYDDWDVILFPAGRDAKIPFKEFKVACHVVPDLELAHIHGAAAIPVMTCFVPSLPPGSGFQISIHCWGEPALSEFAQTYSKHTSLLKFEARIFIDGRQVASTVLDRKVNGPHLVTNTCEFTKTGELQRLRFPPFRRELLYQNHWRPGDDLGRIKIVISEGFPRDSLSVPIERVKNVVAFSFQHAPLEILEANSIAWPNQAMWQSVLCASGMPVPTYQVDEGPSSHAHSPNRKTMPLRHLKNPGFAGTVMTNAISQNPESTPLGVPAAHAPSVDFDNPGAAHAPSCLDPFAGSASVEWLNATEETQPGDLWDPMTDMTAWYGNQRHCRQGISDMIMSDYMPPPPQQQQQQQQPPVPISDAMHVSEASFGFESSALRVPTNTPVGRASEDGQSGIISGTQKSPMLPAGFASCLARSLLNQPFPLPIGSQACSSSAQEANTAVKDGLDVGRGHGKTNNSPALPTPSSSMRTEGAGQGEKCLALPSGATGSNAPKRPRNFTPASAKAMDEVDEPCRMSSPVQATSFGVVDLVKEVEQ